jgi:hypothetical protein
MASITAINGLPLPHDLIALIEAGRWKPLTDLSGVERLFPDLVARRPHLTNAFYSPFVLYSLALMSAENGGWATIESKPWAKTRRSEFLGAPDPDHAPGDIDPSLSFLIADVGLGYEQPIALDYRVSMDAPRVLTLKWGVRGGENRWVTIAPDIRTFAELVGL